MITPELRKIILSRLGEFASLPQSKWQREVMLCLLTPQSKPQNAEECMTMLEQKGFFEGELSVTDVAGVLRTSSHYVRFHNTKAKRLCELRASWPYIKPNLCAGDSVSAESSLKERLILVKTVNGFGFKEASHALRNIGRRNLAILDRHILKNLHLEGVIPKIPKTVSPKLYIEIESQFRAFSERVGEEMDVLDLYFWSKETGVVYK